MSSLVSIRVSLYGPLSTQPLLWVHSQRQRYPSVTRAILLHNYID